MIPTLIARIAMIASIAYYAIEEVLFWLSSFMDPSFLKEDFLEIPNPAPDIPLWTILVSMPFSVVTIASLGRAYWAVEQMLRGGKDQDFLLLSHRIRSTSLGLIGFWIGYNFLTGVSPLLMTLHVNANSGYIYDWAPFDSDIVLLILGIAFFAVSDALKRAALIEEENRQFV